MQIREKLLIPGPTEVNEEVLREFSKHPIGHRTEEFSKILKECFNGLKYVFRTKNPVVIISGSGTSGMDASLASILKPGDEVICITGGKFGERFAEIAEAYGAKVLRYEIEWGKSFDRDDLEEFVANSNAKVITLVHNETSTGVRHDAEFVGKLARKYDLLFVMDCISSLGGDYVETDKWNVDLCISGSQKCLSLPPGLSFVAISDKARDVIEENNPRCYYLNLKKYLNAMEKNTTPFTPSINHIFALKKSLELIKKEGLENRIKRHIRIAKSLRNAIRKIGLELFVENDEIASNTVTSIKYPNGIGDDFRKEIRETFGILLAGGQAKLKGKIFRIGHMGNISINDIISTISAIEISLKRRGFNIKLGSGIEEFLESYERINI